MDAEPFIGYGGFWLRVVAAFIDEVILTIATAIVHGWAEPTGFVATPFAGVALHWLYEAGMTASRYRATPGKMAVGLKVTDHAGHPLSFARATGRHFTKYLSLVILAFGFVMVAFTDKKRGLHDMIAGTLVLKNATTPPGPVAATGP
ncbi:MAG: RDD family protein [Alphaproteobacteria bacterium]|nr:RDD family protein [Alphaproteobacteria bacterium]